MEAASGTTVGRTLGMRRLRRSVGLNSSSKPAGIAGCYVPFGRFVWESSNQVPWYNLMRSTRRDWINSGTSKRPAMKPPTWAE